MDATLSQLLESIELTPAGDLQSLSGGDIAAVYRLETRQGQVVIKHDDTARLRGEAEGLRALRGACSSLVVPEVLGLAEGWLIMESLDTVPAGQKSEAALGEGLRGLHSVIGDAHGWHQDNACGRTPQPNAPAVDVAMLTLFGSPGEAFFDAYWNGDAPTSWPRREALFQLYPLLNHLVLFGAGYRSAVERCVARLESFA